MKKRKLTEIHKGVHKDNRMSLQSSQYVSEDTLVKDFCSVLETDEHPWGQLQVKREFDYTRGRTDVVAIDCDGDVIAFEMKLEKWKQAAHQAYKNTCFAHLSYVVLPESTARRAQRGSYEFIRRSVGLCYIKANAVVIALPAPRQRPLQPWLSHIATSEIAGGENYGF